LPNTRSSIHGAALPKARQWLQWLAYADDTLPREHGWPAAVRDTLVGLHHGVATAARRLRGNPTWDLQGTMTEDTLPLADEAVRWVSLAESVLARPDFPERLRPFAEVLEGACRQQVRLAREIDRMQRAGELVVAVDYDRAAERLVEAG
jgi:hypothetical protein